MRTPSSGTTLLALQSRQASISSTAAVSQLATAGLGHEKQYLVHNILPSTTSKAIQAKKTAEGATLCLGNDLQCNSLQSHSQGITQKASWPTSKLFNLQKSAVCNAS